MSSMIKPKQAQIYGNVKPFSSSQSNKTPNPIHHQEKAAIKSKSDQATQTVAARNFDDEQVKKLYNISQKLYAKNQKLKVGYKDLEARLAQATMKMQSTREFVEQDMLSNKISNVTNSVLSSTAADTSVIPSERPLSNQNLFDEIQNLDYSKLHKVSAEEKQKSNDKPNLLDEIQNLDRSELRKVSIEQKEKKIFQHLELDAIQRAVLQKFSNTNSDENNFSESDSDDSLNNWD